LIFESMNSTGRELSQADLIRNFILMGLDPSLQTSLYEQFWRPMEVDFGQDAYATQFDSFMRYYLTVKAGELPNVGEVYDKFKAYAGARRTAQAGVTELVADIREFSRYFCAMALGTEPDPELKLAFQDLRDLKVDVAYPFLLELYHDYVSKMLSAAEFLAAVRLVEAYVFRRAICAIPTNSLSKTFATFSKALKKDRYLESIKAHALLMPSYRGFPIDEEFRRELQTRDLYKFPRRSYWLRRLENYGRKERVPVDEYTIEHILPQNEKLSSVWRLALGPEWKRVQETWVHTLGNLTLTGYNSEYSDHSFEEKRDMTGGFRESPLRLNKGLGELEVWNEDTIKGRASRLSEVAVKVWPLPNLPSEVLHEYKSTPDVSGYTIANHPHLVSGKMQDIFEAFRKEVLALDPCVTEEFLKFYVAYKAETNFVDVVAQAKRLKLSLNMRFSEISDIRRLCKDVTGLGQWGNGDVEVSLASKEDLPYIMGLVRQSFESQMGSSGEL
jgi:predicted transport protein